MTFWQTVGAVILGLLLYELVKFVIVFIGMLILQLFLRIRDWREHRRWQARMLERNKPQ